MGSFSFTTDIKEVIKEDRSLHQPAGTPTDPVTVAMTPADEAAPTGRRLLAQLLDFQVQSNPVAINCYLYNLLLFLNHKEV